VGPAKLDVMDAPADQPTQAAVQRVEPRRRRPSGQPPPLPHHLQTTGVGWLTAAVVLVTLSLLVFAGELRGPAVALTVAEDGMIRWLAGFQPPGLLPAMRALATCDTGGAIEQPADRPGTRRYERTGQGGADLVATWYTVFPGGCVTARLYATDPADTAMANEARSMIDFTARQALQQELARRSDGRLRLDPPPA
jgi:hypothetical protein